MGLGRTQSGMGGCWRTAHQVDSAACSRTAGERGFCKSRDVPECPLVVAGWLSARNQMRTCKREEAWVSRGCALCNRHLCSVDDSVEALNSAKQIVVSTIQRAQCQRNIWWKRLHVTKGAVGSPLCTRPRVQQGRWQMLVETAWVVHGRAIADLTRVRLAELKDGSSSRACGWCTHYPEVAIEAVVSVHKQGSTIGR